MKRIALLALTLLLLGAPVALAEAWVHGIVQDDAYQPVTGGTIRVEREVPGGWVIDRIDIQMQGHAFGWSLTQTGRYRVLYEHPEYEVVWVRSGEFTLETAPFGDIQVNVRRKAAPTATATPTDTPTPQATYTNPPPPTTLMPPTVNPTATPSGWRRPYGVISWFGTWAYGTDAMRSDAVGFLQLSEMWQWNVIEAARAAQNRPLTPLLEVQHDPLWLSGADMELGCQETNRFEVGPYEGMGFCQAIIVRER